MMIRDQIIESEKQLIAAMKSGDIEKLDSLIHDDLIFVNHLGQVFTKEMDLNSYRLGLLIIKDIQVIAIVTKEYSDCAIVNVEVKMAGTYAKEQFSDKVRFLRTWKKFDNGWKIIAGSSGILQ